MLAVDECDWQMNHAAVNVVLAAGRSPPCNRVVVVGTEVVKNKENIASYEYEPTCASKACSPGTVVSKSLTAELSRRAGAAGGGGGLSDGGNIYTQSPPSSSLISSSSSALRRCQSLLDTATTTTALSWQQQPPAMTSQALHSTSK